MEILHQNNGEEMMDAEHDAFLEDAFVLPDVPDEEEDNMFEIVDVVCDTPHKSEEFSDDAMDFIANPKNKKSAKIHEPEIKISMLDGRKRSVEDADYSYAIVTPAKKGKK